MTVRADGRQNEAFVVDHDLNAFPFKTDRPDPIKSIATLNEQNLEQALGYKKLPSDNILHSTKTYVKKYYKPSGGCLLNYILDRFPFFRWITSYNVKEDFLKDLIAGLTIGVIHIPQ
jgi:hypothetical protein